MRRLFLDTETTGASLRDGNKIIEIAIIETINFEKTGNNFHTLINPQREVEDGAYRVHGKNLASLQGSPVFADIANDMLKFIENSEIIAHNAPFDINFINSELRSINLPDLTCEVTDSLMIARRTFPAQPASLDALCKRFGIDLSKRTFHGALLDAELLYDVFMELIKTLEERGIYEYKKKDEGRITDIKRNKFYGVKKASVSNDKLEEHKNFLKTLGINFEE